MHSGDEWVYAADDQEIYKVNTMHISRAAFIQKPSDKIQPMEI